MKKLFVLLIILGILGMVFLFPWSAAEVQANDSMRTNERKYFTSYIVERDDTLWDIAGRYMTVSYTHLIFKKTGIIKLKTGIIVFKLYLKNIIYTQNRIDI